MHVAPDEHLSTCKQRCRCNPFSVTEHRHSASILNTSVDDRPLRQQCSIGRTAHGLHSVLALRLCACVHSTAVSVHPLSARLSKFGLFRPFRRVLSPKGDLCISMPSQRDQVHAHELPHCPFQVLSVTRLGVACTKKPGACPLGSGGPSESAGECPFHALFRATLSRQNPKGIPGTETMH
jgi:hypothetical protein